jgi:hypothetical protein
MNSKYSVDVVVETKYHRFFYKDALPRVAVVSTFPSSNLKNLASSSSSDKHNTGFRDTFAQKKTARGSPDEHHEHYSGTNTFCVPCGAYNIRIEQTSSWPFGLLQNGDWPLFEIRLARDESVVLLDRNENPLGLANDVLWEQMFHVPCEQQGVFVEWARFRSNAAKNGGAVSARGLRNTAITVKHARFEHNRASGQRGGAVAVSGVDVGLQIEDTDFTHNSAGRDAAANSVPGFGGGIAVEGQASARMANIKVNQNVARGGGHGGFLYASFANEIVIQKGRIFNSTSVSGSGGGIAVFASRFVLDNVEIRQCSAASAGGGMYMDGDAEAHVIGSSFANNMVELGNGGHINVAASKLMVHNELSTVSWPPALPMFKDTVMLGQAEFVEVHSGRGCASAGYYDIEDAESCLLGSELLGYPNITTGTGLSGIYSRLASSESYTALRYLDSGKVNLLRFRKCQAYKHSSFSNVYPMVFFNPKQENSALPACPRERPIKAWTEKRYKEAKIEDDDGETGIWEALQIPTTTEEKDLREPGSSCLRSCSLNAPCICRNRKKRLSVAAAGNDDGDNGALPPHQSHTSAIYRRYARCNTTSTLLGVKGEETLDTCISLCAAVPACRFFALGNAGTPLAGSCYHEGTKSNDCLNKEVVDDNEFNVYELLSRDKGLQANEPRGDARKPTIFREGHAKRGGAIFCSASKSPPSRQYEVFSSESDASCSTSSTRMVSTTGSKEVEFACFGKGVWLANGTKIQDSTAAENGGASAATICDLAMQGTLLSGNTAREGGAVHLGSTSVFRSSGGVVFHSNAATLSGGALVCEACETIDLNADRSGRDGSARNRFLDNRARGGSGGAMRIQAPAKTVSSASSYFENNTADRDGGAVFMSMPLSDDAPGVWSSKGDTFSGNKADHGSGGALAVEGTQVHLSGATICKNNAANDGGGGCLFWDALADDANSPRWASLKPVVDNDTFTSLGNTALFQDQKAGMATPPRFFALENDGASSTKVWAMNAQDAGPQAGGFAGDAISPVFILQDAYLSNVRLDGSYSAGILPLSIPESMEAALEGDYAGDAELYGGVQAVRKLRGDGTTFYTFGGDSPLRIKGKPSTGPHQVSVTASVNCPVHRIFKTHIAGRPSGNAKLELSIDACKFGISAEGSKCIPCPAKTTRKVVNGFAKCVCDPGKIVHFGELADDLTIGYYNASASSASVKCDAGERFCCSACPTGADCTPPEYPRTVMTISEQERSSLKIALRHDEIPSHSLEIHELTPKPGYWRGDQSSDRFVPCTEHRVDANREEAAQLCCPVLENGQASICKSTIQNTTKSVCKTGYTGPLCRACDTEHNYVAIGATCIECRGGAQFGAAFGASLLACLALYVIMLIVLLCLKKERGAGNATGKAPKLIGQMKLLLNFAQILSAMSVAMPGVPWPATFKTMSLGLGFVNFDLLDLFAGPNTCTLAVSALYKFIVHMSMPPMLVGVIMLAFVTSKAVDRLRAKATTAEDGIANLGEHALDVKWETTMKAIVLVPIFLYPGVCTRIFGLLRCDEVEGRAYMSLDYSVACWQGDHGGMVVAAIVCLIVYVIGVPVTIFGVLYKNREALHDEAHPRHKAMKFEVGGLFMNCEFRPLPIFPMLFYALFLQACFKFSS